MVYRFMYLHFCPPLIGSVQQISYLSCMLLEENIDDIWAFSLVFLQEMVVDVSCEIEIDVLFFSEKATESQLFKWKVAML